jgi:hypothetical protein
MRRLGLDVRRRWTTADDEKLRMLWGAPLKAVARAMKRTQITCYWRAQKLGLGLGCPQGYERLSHAAERTGFACGQLREILKFAGVGIHAGIRRPSKKRPGSFFVDPDDVDAAVATWMQTETIASAARRMGTTWDVVRNHLEAFGLAKPKRASGRRHWRVPSETIDKAMSTVARRGCHLVRVDSDGRKAA